jgi:hypothetical protein
LVEGRRRAAPKPTWLRRLPPIRVGWSGCKVERSLMSVHGYLTWMRLVSAASDEPGRQAGLTRACVSWACVRRRTRGCARGYWWCGSVQHAAHARAAQPSCVCPRSRAHDRWSSAASSSQRQRAACLSRSPSRDIVRGYSRVWWHGVRYHSRFYYDSIAQHRTKQHVKSSTATQNLVRDRSGRCGSEREHLPEPPTCT